MTFNLLLVRFLLFFLGIGMGFKSSLTRWGPLWLSQVSSTNPKLSASSMGSTAHRTSRTRSVQYNNFFIINIFFKQQISKYVGWAYERRLSATVSMLVFSNYFTPYSIDIYCVYSVVINVTFRFHCAQKSQLFLTEWIHGWFCVYYFVDWILFCLILFLMNTLSPKCLQPDFDGKTSTIPSEFKEFYKPLSDHPDKMTESGSTTLACCHNNGKRSLFISTFRLCYDSYV